MSPRVRLPAVGTRASLMQREETPPASETSLPFLSLPPATTEAEDDVRSFVRRLRRPARTNKTGKRDTTLFLFPTEAEEEKSVPLLPPPSFFSFFRPFHPGEGGEGEETAREGGEARRRGGGIGRRRSRAVDTTFRKAVELAPSSSSSPLRPTLVVHSAHHSCSERRRQRVRGRAKKCRWIELA